MFKKLILAALFFVMASSSFAFSGTSKEAAICIIEGRVIIFNDTHTISYEDNRTVVYLPRSKDGNALSYFYVNGMNTCMYIKDYAKQHKLYKKLKDGFSGENTIVIETQR